MRLRVALGAAALGLTVAACGGPNVTANHSHSHGATSGVTKAPGPGANSKPGLRPFERSLAPVEKVSVGFDAMVAGAMPYGSSYSKLASCPFGDSPAAMGLNSSSGVQASPVHDFYVSSESTQKILACVFGSPGSSGFGVQVISNSALSPPPSPTPTGTPSVPPGWSLWTHSYSDGEGSVLVWPGHCAAGSSASCGLAQSTPGCTATWVNVKYQIGVLMNISASNSSGTQFSVASCRSILETVGPRVMASLAPAP